MHIQSFLDSVHVLRGRFPPKCQFVAVFSSIELFMALQATGKMPLISSYGGYDLYLPILCMSIAKQFYLGDFFAFKNPIPRPLGYVDFEEAFQPLVLDVWASHVSTRTRTLELIKGHIGDDPEMLTEAKAVALKFGKKAINIADIEAFAAAVCKVILYKFA